MIEKIKLHIPTEQYGFIEVEMDGNPHDIINDYKSVLEKIPHIYDLNTQSLSDKDFNAMLDAYLTHGNELSATQYENMSNEQQNIIQALKRAFKRIKSHENKNIQSDLSYKAEMNDL